MTFKKFTKKGHGMGGEVKVPLHVAERMVREAVLAERERCAEIIPTTWLDPLLTGEDAVMGEPPYTAKDIEKLLQYIATAIEKDLLNGSDV